MARRCKLSTIFQTRPGSCAFQSLGGAPEEVLAIIKLHGGSVSVSPDGARLVYAADEALSDVWLAENFDPDVR